MFKVVMSWIARHPVGATLVAAGLVLGLFIVVAVIWSVRIANRAESLAAELRSTENSAEAAIFETDPDSLREISASLELSMETAGDLKDDLWPLRWAGVVAGWIPYLGDNITAVPNLVERLNHDLEAAASLVHAADGFASIYEELSGSDEGLVATLGSLPSESEITRLGELIDRAGLSLAKAEKKSSKVNDGRLWGQIGVESGEIRERETRMREIIDWSALVTVSLLELTRLGEGSLPLAGILDGGNLNPEEFTRESLSAMADLETLANAAANAVTAASAIIPAGIGESSLGQMLVDFEPILIALAGTTGSASRVWAAVSPALDEMESSPGGLIGEGSGLLMALELLRAKRSDLAEERTTLGEVTDHLRSSRLKTLKAASAALSLANGTEELARVVGFLADFSEIGPEALGANGTRRYLVLGETSDELRGSGGFISGVWVITFSDGHLEELEYHDIVSVDDRSRLSEYPLPPALLARHMDTPVWLLRDAAWSPEFPAAAQAASEIFLLGKDGVQVDGVIGLTQWAIIGLGAALGGITTDHGVIEPADLISTIEAGTDDDGRAFLDTVFRGVLAQFSDPGVNDRLFGLAVAAADLLDRKDTQVYMVDPELQAVMEKSGWDGSLNGPTGDRIAVIDSNVGWSKVDRNIERSMTYDVTLRRSEPVRAQLSLSYRNVSQPDSRACDIQAPVHTLSYAELKEACYWNLVRVYFPEAGKLISADPIPIPGQSVYARLGAGIPGGDSVGVSVGPGGKFISGLLVVPPGETVTTSFDLEVPSSAFVIDGSMAVYQLALAAQPGALGRQSVLRVELPPGYEYVSSSAVPAQQNGDLVEFAFLLKTDIELEVHMSRTPVTSALQSGPSPARRAQVALQ